MTFYIPQPPSTIEESGYTFVVTDMLTGTILDEVELQSLNWDELYGRPGGGQATARLDDPKTNYINFKSWSNGLWVIKDGDIRWGGFMGGIQPQASTRVINIPLFGWEEYLRHQLIVDNRNMAFATFNPFEHIIRWNQKDQLAIVADIINHVQDTISNQNVGISVSYSPSGVLRDLQVPQWEGKFAGEVLEEMADNINGFDWYHEYFWDDNTPRVQIKLVYPREARQTNYVLEFDQDGGETNILTYDLDGGHRPATRLLGQGEGDGPNMLIAHNWEVLPGQVNYDAVSAHKTISELSTLQERLTQEKIFRRVVKPQLSAKLDPFKEPGYTEYRCGDMMDVRISDGYIQISKEYKVIGKSIVLSKQHDEQVEVTLFDLTAGDELEDVTDEPA